MVIYDNVTKLKSEEIPVSDRIMAIADVYDTLITKRTYKDSVPHDVAVSMIIEGKGKAFDPKIIDIFEEIHYKFEFVNI